LKNIFKIKRKSKNALITHLKECVFPLALYKHSNIEIISGQRLINLLIQEVVLSQAKEIK